jgi:hypothetical protein
MNWECAGGLALCRVENEFSESASQLAHSKLFGRAVSQILFLIAIYLSDRTRCSSDAGRVITAYLVLLPMGFSVPPTLLSAR